MTGIELCFYERLDDEIDARAYEICKELDLLCISTYEVFVANGKVIINIIDNENACVDHLRMTFEQFSSNDYLEKAKKVRRADIEQKERAEKEAKERQKIIDYNNRKILYEELRKEFE